MPTQAPVRWQGFADGQGMVQELTVPQVYKIDMEDLDKVLLLLCLQGTWAALPNPQDGTLGIAFAQEHQVTGNRQPTCKQ